MGLYFTLLVLLGGQFEPFNDLFQLVPFPSGNYQAYLMGIMLFNTAGTLLVEMVSRRMEQKVEARKAE